MRRARNLDRSLEFYRDLLGLEVVLRVDPDSADAEGGIAAGLRIAGVLVPGGVVLELSEGMRGGTGSSYVLALGVPDVRAAQREVVAAGLKPTMPPTEVMPGVTMMFVADPDGRTIEFVEFGSGATTSWGNLQAQGQAQGDV